MKKISLLLLPLAFLFYSECAAAGINFLENRTWKEILAQAKRENKLIFLDAYATWCGPCKYLQKEVFTDKEVGNYFNSKFINVKIDMEAGEGIELAELYNVASYPTLFFINGNGEVVHKYIGAMESEDFIELGKTAFNPETQYYPLKEKAKKNKLAPEDFHNWIHAAEKLEDEDLPGIVNSYISSVSYPVLGKDMLEIVMDHGSLNGKKQIDELFSNRDDVSATLGISEESFNARFLEKIVAFGFDRLVKDEINISQYESLIRAYYPEHVKLETKKARVNYFKSKKNSEKGLAELKELLSDPSYKLGANDMAGIMLEMIVTIGEEDREKEFINLVNSFRLQKEDADKTYYKDFTVALLYYSLEDLDNLEVYVKKLTDNENTPDSLLQFIIELLEE